jgi:hypothetical protein
LEAAKVRRFRDLQLGLTGRQRNAALSSGARARDRAGINNHEQTVIWVLRHGMTSLKRNCSWGEK